METRTILRSEPQYLRANVAHGSSAIVDRQGGRFGAGMISGVSIISRGEALGHGFWIDVNFMSEVADQVNLSEKGVKSRFTHPGLSGDGLGKFLGRIENARANHENVIGDLHLSKASRRGPDGDLGSYVMDLAEEDPEAFGVSIVFEADERAQEDFIDEHGSDQGDFESPDVSNAEHLPHARLARLRAADVVDDPAANPNGLFYREQELAHEGDRLLSYAFGLTEVKPVVTQLSIDPDRGKQFLQRFLTNHSMEVKVMEEVTDQVAEDEIEAQPESDTTPAEAAAESVEELTTSEEQQPLAAKFLEAYGEQGAVWFCEGKTFEEATKLHYAGIEEQNRVLKQKLSAREGAQGEEEPLFFDTEDQRNRPKGMASVIRVGSNNN